MCSSVVVMIDNVDSVKDFWAGDYNESDSDYQRVDATRTELM